MLFKYKDGELEAQAFYNYTHLDGKEKDLEDLLANNLGKLYVEDGQLMLIFRERQWQEEPDICALDENGNLIIFELKRGEVKGDTTIQIMRYVQNYGQKKYNQLEEMFQKFKNTTQSLQQAHAETFGIEDNPLSKECFNKCQKMVIVGNSSDTSLISAVDYWKSKHLDIDFLPYRFYKIEEEIYFEFFSKPYDYHINPRHKKGILFDTNRSYNENSVWDMFANSKISAYGNACKYIKSFNRGDYVLYYHKGKGVIGAGKIKKSNPREDLKKEELYHEVELLTPVIKEESEIRSISASDLCDLLGKNFYFASTIKSPFLSVNEAERVVDELRKRYNT